MSQRQEIYVKLCEPAYATAGLVSYNRTFGLEEHNTVKLIDYGIVVDYLSMGTRRGLGMNCGTTCPHLIFTINLVSLSSFQIE